MNVSKNTSLAQPNKHGARKHIRKNNTEVKKIIWLLKRFCILSNLDPSKPHAIIPTLFSDEFEAYTELILECRITNYQFEEIVRRLYRKLYQDQVEDILTKYGLDINDHDLYSKIIANDALCREEMSLPIECDVNFAYYAWRYLIATNKYDRALSDIQEVHYKFGESYSNVLVNKSRGPRSKPLKCTLTEVFEVFKYDNIHDKLLTTYKTIEKLGFPINSCNKITKYKIAEFFLAHPNIQNMLKFPSRSYVDSYFGCEDTLKYYDAFTCLRCELYKEFSLKKIFRFYQVFDKIFDLHMNIHNDISALLNASKSCNSIIEELNIKLQEVNRIFDIKHNEFIKKNKPTPKTIDYFLEFIMVFSLKCVFVEDINLYNNLSISPVQPQEKLDWIFSIEKNNPNIKIKDIPIFIKKNVKSIYQILFQFQDDISRKTLSNRAKALSAYLDNIAVAICDGYKTENIIIDNYKDRSLPLLYIFAALDLYNNVNQSSFEFKHAHIPSSDKKDKKTLLSKFNKSNDKQYSMERFWLLTNISDSILKYYPINNQQIRGSIYPLIIKLYEKLLLCNTYEYLYCKSTYFNKIIEDIKIKQQIE